MTTAMPRIARGRGDGVPDLVQNALQSRGEMHADHLLVEPTLGRRLAAEPASDVTNRGRSTFRVRKVFARRARPTAP